MESGGGYRVAAFREFRELVRSACGASENWDAPRQVTYLESYLGGMPGRPAASLVVEKAYVDRHYLEEYTAYYATALRPPPGHATRLHVFCADLQDEDLAALVRRAASGSLNAVQEELEASYLGYVTVRPISSAPIGRTMLIPYPPDGGRHYHPAIRDCCARIMGIELRFRALPFQQQDQGVGACASAALWASTAKVSRDSGMRAPTPFAVTAAATRNWVTDRVLPAAGGLELGQFASAVRELGLAPYHVKVDREPEMFLWTLKVYLRSGLPAVLVLRDEGEVHAVAVAGHKEAVGELTELGNRPRVLRYGALTRVYVHDDRIGPYVKMSLSVSQSDGWPRVLLQRVPVDDPSDTELTTNTWVAHAIYPLYPKLRLTARDLAELAGELAPLFRLLLGADHAAGLTVEGWFVQNGAYLRELFESGADSERVEYFVRHVRLSRYVGVLRWYLDGEALADVVCDTTDIRRSSAPYGPVLGIFFYNARQVQAARTGAADLMREAVLA